MYRDIVHPQSPSNSGHSIRQPCRRRRLWAGGVWNCGPPQRTCGPAPAAYGSGFCPCGGTAGRFARGPRTIAGYPICGPGCTTCRPPPAARWNAFAAALKPAPKSFMVSLRRARGRWYRSGFWELSSSSASGLSSPPLRRASSRAWRASKSCLSSASTLSFSGQIPSGAKWS